MNQTFHGCDKATAMNGSRKEGSVFRKWWSITTERAWQSKVAQITVGMKQRHRGREEKGTEIG